jgi:hypothetical protein
MMDTKALIIHKPEWRCHHGKDSARFWGTPKTEPTRHRYCQSRQEAKRDIEEYIERSFTTVRRSGRNSAISPRPPTSFGFITGKTLHRVFVSTIDDHPHAVVG